MEISKIQIEQVNSRIKALIASDSFYGKKLKSIGVTEINSAEEFKKLPFSEKKDLRDAYPLGLMTAPEKDIVRIHSSSGTTGTPVVIPYTAKDVDDWAVQFKRCYEMAGITNMDRIQITPGYGRWTAGIGFQNGAEKLGAMAIPMGPGNKEKQLEMMQCMKSTVLCSTSSYALLLAEEIQKRGIKDKIYLKKGVNVFPSQIEEVLNEFSETSSEYQIRISHLDGRDTMRIYVESGGEVSFDDLGHRISEKVKSRIGFTPIVKVVEVGVLPRSTKKTARVIDERYN